MPQHIANSRQQCMTRRNLSSRSTPCIGRLPYIGVEFEGGERLLDLPLKQIAPKPVDPTRQIGGRHGREATSPMAPFSIIGKVPLMAQCRTG